MLTVVSQAELGGKARVLLTEPGPVASPRTDDVGDEYPTCLFEQFDCSSRPAGLDRCRQLATANPARYLPSLANSLTNIGAFLSHLGRLAEALPSGWRSRGHLPAASGFQASAIRER